jgi:methylthioribulose-1-phosphate dehydratase
MTRDVPTDRTVLQGYELLKAFEGINSHEETMLVPIFDNDQDVSRLSQQIGQYLDDHPNTRAYIIRGHGFYTWAKSIDRSIQHCEALEFLLQCEFNSAGMGNLKGN